jgi:hypothetical protein
MFVRIIVCVYIYIYIYIYISCRTEQILPPEDGTYVSKHVGEFHLTFVLTTDVHLVGTIHGVR